MAPLQRLHGPCPSDAQVGCFRPGGRAAAGGSAARTCGDPASPPPDGGFWSCPRSAQDQALQEEGLTRRTWLGGRRCEALRHHGQHILRPQAQLPATDGDVVRSGGLHVLPGPSSSSSPTRPPRASSARPQDQAVLTTGTVWSPKRRVEGQAAPLVVLSRARGMGDPCAPSRQLAMGMNYEGISLASCWSTPATTWWFRTTSAWASEPPTPT
ncbi:hypothetical protein QJS66_16275 [Kocuria rhizophila]|nr:hypothetical protein QJS66_16275 [Kocuria rhizophila]